MDITNNFRGEFLVNFKGKDLKAMFSMNAIRLLLRGEGIKLENFDKWVAEDAMTSLPTIAYYSVLNKCVQDGKKFAAPKEQFIAFCLDNNDLEVISDAITGALAIPEEVKSEGK